MAKKNNFSTRIADKTRQHTRVTNRRTDGRTAGETQGQTFKFVNVPVDNALLRVRVLDGGIVVRLEVVLTRKYTLVFVREFAYFMKA